MSEAVALLLLRRAVVSLQRSHQFDINDLNAAALGVDDGGATVLRNQNKFRVRHWNQRAVCQT